MNEVALRLYLAGTPQVFHVEGQTAQRIFAAHDAVVSDDAGVFEWEAVDRPLELLGREEQRDRGAPMMPRLSGRKAGDQIAEGEIVHERHRMHRAIRLVSWVYHERSQARAEHLIEIPGERVDGALLGRRKLRHATHYIGGLE